MRIALPLFTLLALLVVACSPKVAPTRSDTGKKSKNMPAVSYATDIVPIMQRSCTPCHYPAQGGRKEPLDSYAAVSNHIDEMIARVSMSKLNPKYMPYNGKKDALSPEEIELFKAWVAGGKKE